MGYRCRWIATRADRVETLARLGLEVAGELKEEVYDPGLYAVEMGNGWTVVIGDGRGFMDQLEREQAARVSDQAESVFLFTDDSPMCAEIVAFARGRETWSISYDGSKGPATPKLEGDLPGVVRSRLRDALEKQKAAGKSPVDHIYDFVAESGKALVGFRHDQTLAEGEHLPILQLRPRRR